MAIAVALLSAGAVGAQPAADAPPEAAPEPPDPEKEKLDRAIELFLQGNELRKAGDHAGALVKYVASRELVASVPNTTNAAICLDKLERFDEALEMYEELLTKFRDKLTQADRDEVAPEMARLRARLGSVDVQANVAATLVIDGRERGKLPLVAAVRVLPGPRVVQVIKEGYQSFKQTVEVQVGQTVRVDAQLKPLVSAGYARIDETALEGSEVFVDGAPIGTVPWDGALEPGTHYFYVRKADVGSAPKEFVIVKGQKVLLSADVGRLGPELTITVEPPTAELRIGGVLVGAGRWQGRLPVGQHEISAREEGYFEAKQALQIGADVAADQVLRLKADEEHARWGVRESGALWLDVVGGFGIVSGFGSGAEKSCDSHECSEDPAALGFIVGGRGGYEFPFGLSLEIAGGYLSASKTLVRGIDTTVGNPPMAIRYDLEDALRVSGPFAGAGVGYRLPFAEIAELRGHLLVGALFSFARDDMTATATAGGKTIGARVTDSGVAAGAANLFVMPALEFGLRFGGFGVGLGVSATIVALEGPEQKNGDLAVDQGNNPCPIGSLDVECTAANDVVKAETAYGPFVMLAPSVSVGYLF